MLIHLLEQQSNKEVNIQDKRSYTLILLLGLGECIILLKRDKYFIYNYLYVVVFVFVFVLFLFVFCFFL